MAALTSAAATPPPPKRKRKEPPAGYVCKLCSEPGHWVYECGLCEKKPKAPKPAPSAQRGVHGLLRCLARHGKD